jgi:DNA transformation protein
VGAAENSFVAYVLDQLGEVDGLGCRAMFGGHGLYRGPTFFGIVFAGRVYLKTDEATVQEYTRRGMAPFQPGDRQLLKTYYEVPADVLEVPHRFTAWAEAAAERLHIHIPLRPKNHKLVNVHIVPRPHGAGTWQCLQAEAGAHGTRRPFPRGSRRLA